LPDSAGFAAVGFNVAPTRVGHALDAIERTFEISRCAIQGKLASLAQLIVVSLHAGEQPTLATCNLAAEAADVATHAPSTVSTAAASRSRILVWADTWVGIQRAVRQTAETTMLDRSGWEPLFMFVLSTNNGKSDQRATVAASAAKNDP
jgi:hypothetical protein